MASRCDCCRRHTHHRCDCGRMSAYSLAARVEDTTISGSGPVDLRDRVSTATNMVCMTTLSAVNASTCIPTGFGIWMSWLQNSITGAYHTWAPMFEIALGERKLLALPIFGITQTTMGMHGRPPNFSWTFLSRDLDAIVWMLSDLDTTGACPRVLDGSS